MNNMNMIIEVHNTAYDGDDDDDNNNYCSLH